VGRASWRLLRAGSGQRVPGQSVLCVDFPYGRSPAQAGFADLAPLLPDRYGVWGVGEDAWLTAESGPGPVLGALAEPWPPGGVAGVFGYGAGGSLACRLARILVARGVAEPDLPVVLFDPTTVTAGTLRSCFQAALRSIATNASAAARTDAGTDARAEDVRADGRVADLGALAGALAGRYAAVAQAACAAQGVPTAVADQLCDRVAGHLRYLAYSAAVPMDPPDPTVLVRSATQPGNGPHVRLPVDGAALLADRAAAGVASRLLAGETLAGETLAAT
jgi:hypothetical protein